jgi:hypothetical protein
MDPKYRETVSETKSYDCDYIMKVCEDCDTKHSYDKCFTRYFNPSKWMRVTVRENVMHTSYWHNMHCDGKHEGQCKVIPVEKPSFWSGLSPILLH